MVQLRCVIIVIIVHFTAVFWSVCLHMLSICITICATEDRQTDRHTYTHTHAHIYVDRWLCADRFLASVM